MNLHLFPITDYLPWLHALSDLDQQFLVLFHGLDGYRKHTFEEIATPAYDVWGACTPQHVKWRIRQAHKQLVRLSKGKEAERWDFALWWRIEGVKEEIRQILVERRLRKAGRIG